MSSVKLPYPTPTNILTPDSALILLPSPEGSCAPESLAPSSFTQGQSQNPKGEILSSTTPPIPQPLLRNFRAQRALNLERRTLSPSLGSATEQLCDFGQVALHF